MRRARRRWRRAAPHPRPPPLPAGGGHFLVVSLAVSSASAWVTAAWKKRCRLCLNISCVHAAGVLEGRTWLIRGCSPPCLAQPHPYRLARRHVASAARRFLLCHPCARVDHGVWAAASVYQPAAAPERPRRRSPRHISWAPRAPNALYYSTLWFGENALLAFDTWFFNCALFAINFTSWKLHRIFSFCTSWH